MRDTTEERIVDNNLTFRRANERIRAKAEEYEAPLELIPFLCECADDECLGRVAMNLADYDDIHRDRDHYAILHDHKMVDGAICAMLRKPIPAG